MNSAGGLAAVFTPAFDDGGSVTGLGLGGALLPSTLLGLDLPSTSPVSRPNDETPNSPRTGEMSGFESKEKSMNVLARFSLELEMLFSKEWKVGLGRRGASDVEVDVGVSGNLNSSERSGR